MPRPTLGDYLRKVREERRLTQEQVETRSGGRISREYLSLLERGERRDPSLRILRALAAVYDVSLKTLLIAVQNEMLQQPVTAETPPVDEAREIARLYSELNKAGRNRLLEHARLLRYDFGKDRN
jgi:transcriptional regulator with XRE-family HTH domain